MKITPKKFEFTCVHCEPGREWVEIEEVEAISMRSAWVLFDNREKGLTYNRVINVEDMGR